MSKETTGLFDELVAKGKKIDSESHEKLSEAKTKTTSTIEERINKVRNSLHFGSSAADVAELNQKVDALTEKVDALLDALVEKKATKARSSSAA